MEEALSAVQQAHAPQGNQVSMAENVIVRSVGTTSTFLKEVQQEMKKVTWPDKAQLRQATMVILVFVGIVGLVIFAMDWVLQLVLLQLIPALFGA